MTNFGNLMDDPITPVRDDELRRFEAKLREIIRQRDEARTLASIICSSMYIDPERRDKMLAKVRKSSWFDTGAKDV